MSATMITDCGYDRRNVSNSHRVYKPLVKFVGEHYWHVLHRTCKTATLAVDYARNVRDRYNRLFFQVSK